MVLKIWMVDPESRIAEFFSGYWVMAKAVCGVYPV